MFNYELSNNLKGKKEDSKLRLKSNYIKYLLWMILCIIIIALVINTSLSNNESITLQIAVLIIIGVSVYKILTYIYNIF
uniref:Uncharacterized protein n=1 Tax=viral metagenome TaxID=1070528 RepID=A0A6C0AZ81_9ZZZZ|tara:strand:+ start:1282 stop:1518 length:237 start_codon:yes stop_codon:yes gene_type:complete